MRLYKRNNAILEIIILACILIVSMIASAYFIINSKNDNNENISIKTATLELVFDDETKTGNNLEVSLKFGESITKTLIVKNNGTKNVDFQLYWDNLVNAYQVNSLTFTLGETIEYDNSEDKPALTESSYSPVATYTTNVPRTSVSTTTPLSKGLTISAGKTKYYLITIKLNMTDYDQNSELSAKLSTKFTIKEEIEEPTSTAMMTLDALNLGSTVKSSSALFNSTAPNIDTNQESGIFEWIMDNGNKIYYYRGATANNYVKFGTWKSDVYKRNGKTAYNFVVTDYEFSSLPLCEAATEITLTSGESCTRVREMTGLDMYWRIIRVNEDGSIRMIYDGTSPYVNGVDNIDRIALQNVPWNYQSYEQKNIGYIYNVGENKVSSNIKTQLENWYTTNLSDMDDKITKETFCNDRTVGSTSNSWIFYGALERIQNNTTPAPSLECIEDNAYIEKIGLVSLDEAALAGAYKSTENNQYYLYKGTNYWTMSPADWDGTFAYMSSINNNGSLFFYGFADYSNGMIAPVINLSANVAKTLIGDGTIGNEYRLPGIDPSTL